MAVSLNNTEISVMILITMGLVLSQSVSAKSTDPRITRAAVYGSRKTQYSGEAPANTSNCAVTHANVSGEPYIPSRFPHLQCVCGAYNSPKLECPEWILSRNTPGVVLTNHIAQKYPCVAYPTYAFSANSIINRGEIVYVYTKCIQDTNKYQSKEYLIGVKKAGNQETCVNNEDCYISNQICRGLCYCAREFPILSTTYGCLREASLDEKCEVNKQCTFSIYNSFCSSRRICECEPPYKKDGSLCVLPNTEPPETCPSSSWTTILYVILGVIVTTAVALLYFKWKNTRSPPAAGIENSHRAANFPLIMAPPLPPDNPPHYNEVTSVPSEQDPLAGFRASAVVFPSAPDLSMDPESQLVNPPHYNEVVSTGAPSSTGSSIHLPLLPTNPPHHGDVIVSQDSPSFRTSSASSTATEQPTPPTTPPHYNEVMMADVNNH